MNDLITAVREARAQEVPALVRRLDRTGRRAALAELKSLRQEAKDWDWRKREKIRKALLVAGAGCQPGAAGCASWLNARSLSGWHRHPYPLLLEALADRDPAWLADLATRLAGRPALSDAEYSFVRELAERAGCPVPATDGFVLGWAEQIGAGRWSTSGASLHQVLAEDPHTGVLAPRLFDLTELPSHITWHHHDDPASLRDWPGALGALAAEGILDRPVWVDRCVRRLLRGGKAGDQRFFLSLLRLLALTDQEEDERTSEWIALAADGLPIVAGHAQGVLTRLQARGTLTVRELSEVSGSVLLRSEKRLVRAQLVLLGKVLRHDRTAAGRLLPVVAEAFGHEDLDIQERALKLTARFLPAADGSLREELAVAADRLAAVHHPAAVEVFGGLFEPVPPSQPYEEQLPPAPVARPLGAAPATVAELVVDVAAVVKAASWESPAFERALDGLVRLARTDREELSRALREALTGSWFLPGDDSEQRFWPAVHSPRGLAVVVHPLLGDVPDLVAAKAAARHASLSASPTAPCVHAALDDVLAARLWEAVSFVRTGAVPFLLATPTWHSGGLDAGTLVERLRTYHRMGVEPGPADFAQALLRVRRTGEHAAADEAASLGTPHGDRLAAWIRADEPVAEVVPHGAGGGAPEARNWWGRAMKDNRRIGLATLGNPRISQEFPPAFRPLGEARGAIRNQCYHWAEQPPAHFLATLPQDGETLAAWLLPDLCPEEGRRGAAWILPELAETEGPSADAVHLALAHGLGSPYPQDRLAAVDALLVRAARGRLDTELLGRELTLLIDRDLVKVNRLADAARSTVAAGAHRTVLRLLTPVLPQLLAYERAPHGLHEILAVAAECAETAGTGGAAPPPGLRRLAERGGVSQRVMQAARLLAAYGREVEPGARAEGA
ncbi:DUF6493 family protein [Streptomyces sp. NPDC002308]